MCTTFVDALYTIEFPLSCFKAYFHPLPSRRLLFRLLLLFPLRRRETLEGDGMDVFQLGCQGSVDSAMSL